MRCMTWVGSIGGICDWPFFSSVGEGGIRSGSERAAPIGAAFFCHPGAGRKRSSTAGWLVIQSLGVRLSRYRDLARLPRASVLLPEAGRIHAATLRAFLHPPAASYGDPGDQQPNNARRCWAKRLPCRSALVRDQPTERYIPAPRSRTSALLQGVRRGCRIKAADRSFVGAHPVRDKPTERYTQAWRSRTGCAPTDKPWSPSIGAAIRRTLFTAATALSRTPGHPPPC
jgi:hypothetical protein